MTTSHAPLRRLPLPICEPPYDDEIGHPARHPATGTHAGPAGGTRPAGATHPAAPRRSAGQDDAVARAVQGTLALAFVLPNGLPATPTAPRGLRLVTRPEADETLDAIEFGVQRTCRADLPDPRAWSATFVQAVVETLAGDRPASQLVRWTTSRVHDELRGMVRGGGRRPGVSMGSANLVTSRAVVRSVHLSEPADGVAEVAALVRRGLRSTAIAFRLEGLDGRWQCTALELG